MIKDKYINPKEVVKLLIRYRCEYADKINKRNVMYSVVGQESAYNNQNDDNHKRQKVYSLFPPRRQWVSVGQKKGSNGEYTTRRKSKNQLERNFLSLWFTYLRESEKTNPASWYVELTKYAEKIVEKAFSNKYHFAKPRVNAIVKDDKHQPIICRPVCTFDTLDDKIIASLYNKCLTSILDKLFYAKSYAFRKWNDGDKTFAHLRAVKEIKNFRQSHSGNLWVAECDMKNFYDTINHNVLKKQIRILLHKAYNGGTISQNEYKLFSRIMFCYIDSFNFYDDVFVYNKLQNNIIWKNIKSKNKGVECKFKWIENEPIIKQLKGKKRTNYLRSMGVPQGGALSGLIANCMMHYVDMKLKKYWENNPKFCYIRFCDDMIMIGTSKDEVVNAFEDYKTAIDNCLLFRHEENVHSLKMKDFWNAKTREPYMWGKPTHNVFPWITFVGYDFNWEGDTRIRKKTYKKEIEKQYNKMNELKKILKNNAKKFAPIKNSHYIYRSLYKRLICMSVGRFELRNYQTTDNDMSWAQAFTELTFNKWSATQLRNLDRHRVRIMHKFKKFLIKNRVKFENVKSDGTPNPNPIYFGKPFSYYYQVFKK